MFTGLQNNTLSRSELNYESGTVKNVHYGDVLIKFGDYIDASKEELPFINDDSKVENFKGSFLHNGDIVIADTAEDETVGKCTEIQGVDDIKLISGLHTIPCRPKEEYGAKFLGYYMNSSAYHAQLIPLMQGIKVTSISKSALQDTNMIIPKSVDEQTIIGEYFSNLDHLITLHQYKNYMVFCVKIVFLLYFGNSVSSQTSPIRLVKRIEIISLTRVTRSQMKADSCHKMRSLRTAAR